MSKKYTSLKNVEKFYARMSKKIVNFVIQKLKSKHTSLKKYTNWAKLSHVTQDLECTSWPIKLWANIWKASHLTWLGSETLSDLCKISLLILHSSNTILDKNKCFRLLIWNIGHNRWRETEKDSQRVQRIVDMSLILTNDHHHEHISHQFEKK